MNQKSTEKRIEAKSANLLSAQKKVTGGHVCVLNYDEIPIPCCRVNAQGVVKECNESLATLLGCTKDELLQSWLTKFVDSSSSQAVEEHLRRFFDCKNPPSSTTRVEDVRLRRKNGGSFPATLEIRPVFDRLGLLIAWNIAVTDESKYHMKMQELEQERDKLISNERLKDEFVAVASHELRTPIQPILGSATLAARGMISQQQAWEMVLTEARRLQHLANEILDVSRIDSGSVNYCFKKEIFNELLDSVTDSIRNAVEKPIDIRLLYDEADRDVSVEVDRSRITQVLTNILSNSVKFTDKGSITIESRLSQMRNSIEIKISDTGRGLPKEIIPKLFQKFATRGHSDVQNNKGTGLGLYISRAIVKAHNGEISAYNNESGGATIVITLPVSQIANKV